MNESFLHGFAVATDDYLLHQYSLTEKYTSYMSYALSVTHYIEMPNTLSVIVSGENNSKYIDHNILEPGVMSVVRVNGARKKI